MKVFLIDDEYINNIISSKILSKIDSQLEIVKYTNPSIAFEDMQVENPDLIFLDINMPIFSGWQFLDKMRDNLLGHQVVVLTSSVCKPDNSKALNYPNVIGYAEKPMNREEIRNYINSGLGSLEITANPSFS